MGSEEEKDDDDEEEDIFAEHGLYVPVWYMEMAVPVFHLRFSPGVCLCLSICWCNLRK